jgi:hypothetical protein
LKRFAPLAPCTTAELNRTGGTVAAIKVNHVSRPSSNATQGRHRSRKKAGFYGWARACRLRQPSPEVRSLRLKVIVRMIMRVRIVRQLPRELEGFDLSRFDRDGSYEIHGPLGELLVATGYAVPEDDRSGAIKALAEATISTLPPLPPDELTPPPPVSQRQKSKTSTTRRRSKH